VKNSGKKSTLPGTRDAAGQFRDCPGESGTVGNPNCRCSLGQGGRVSTGFDVATSDIDVFDVTMADNNRSQCVTATPFRRHFPS